MKANESDKSVSYFSIFEIHDVTDKQLEDLEMHLPAITESLQNK